MSEPVKPLFKGKTYDRMKYLALIGLPAIGALYVLLAGYWGLPDADKVAGSLAGVGTFLGLLLGLSSKQYQNSDAKFDGVMKVTKTVDGLTKVDSRLTKIEDPRDIDREKQLLFKVETVSEEPEPGTDVDLSLEGNV